jgi:hypothetical protein
METVDKNSHTREPSWIAGCQEDVIIVTMLSGQEGHRSSSSFNKSWMLWLKGSKVGTPIKMHSDMKYLQVRVIAGRTTAFYLCIVSLHLCLQEHSGPSHCCVEGGTCPGQCNKLESPKLLTPEYKQFPVKRLHGDLTLTAAWCDHKYAKVALPQMVARGLHWHVWVSGS